MLCQAHCSLCLYCIIKPRLRIRLCKKEKHHLFSAQETALLEILYRNIRHSLHSDKVKFEMVFKWKLKQPLCPLVLHAKITKEVTFYFTSTTANCSHCSSNFSAQKQNWCVKHIYQHTFWHLAAFFYLYLFFSLLFLFCRQGYLQTAHINAND